MTHRVPKIIVFDLDYTLWPFWVDTHVTPPFRMGHGNTVLDNHGCKVKFYEEVPKILEKLHSEGYQIGIASRTSEIRGANELIKLFDWDKYITYKEIFSGCKVTHFNNIKRDSHLSFDDMLFFDDEQRNTKDVSRIGVVSILVRNGVTRKVVEEGLNEYAKHHST